MLGRPKLVIPKNFKELFLKACDNSNSYTYDYKGVINKKTIIIETHFSNEFRGVIDIVGEQIKDDNKEVIKLSSGVDVIFAKETKFNAEELHSEEFKELIEKSKKTYDYIILQILEILLYILLYQDFWKCNGFHKFFLLILMLVPMLIDHMLILYL